MTPRSTYRIQFRKEFPFAKAEALAPYLRTLGISHLYSSPILTARSGSNHGYDVVDFTRINPELGGEDAFRSMARTLRDHGVGIILDIVPNHMAVGGSDNAPWLDVLHKGRNSRYASWFDIDFDTDEEGLNGKVLAPFLGKPYRTTLESGELELRKDAETGECSIHYHHHRFPIRPEDQAEVARRASDFYQDHEQLHAILERQNYRLAWWRTAGDRVNYRRFFDITELAGIRIENPDAFEALHRVAFELYEQGLIDGARVDHIDGLSDPAAYCRALRTRLDELQARRPGSLADVRAFVVVEKILAGGEYLALDWSVDGTTGYDFMDEVSALQHHGAGDAILSAIWSEQSGRHLTFEQEEIIARDEMLRVNFHGQCETVVNVMYELVEELVGDRDLTRAALYRALTSIIRHFRVYRTYATGGETSIGPGPAFQTAYEAAKNEPAAEHGALDCIALIMGSKSSDVKVLRAIRRFNQLTAPVAAKSVEDTAFYRYGKLISRNDVGFDVNRLAMPASEFHGRMRRRADEASISMLATATHDHKRGEDVRARLAVISEIPKRWAELCRRWVGLNEPTRPRLSDRGDEYQLYQMIAGAWPLDLAPDDADGLKDFCQRLAGWRQKSLREAKLRSTWIAPNEKNEQAAVEFLFTALDPGQSATFLLSMHGFVCEIASAGVMNSLVQAALKLTVPGIPDLYQGTELWDFSLVDPDNRRPVDYAARMSRADANVSLAECAGDWRSGMVKLKLIQALLELRRDNPALFFGSDYRPVAIDGRMQDHVLAFTRTSGSARLTVAVALHCATALKDGIVPPPGWWDDTRLQCDGSGAATIRAADAFEHLPVAVWIDDTNYLT